MTTTRRLVTAMRDAVRSIEVHTDRGVLARVQREMQSTVRFIERQAARFDDERVPTTGMIGAAKLLVRDLKMRQPYTRGLTDVRTAVDKLDRLVDRLYVLRVVIGDDDLDSGARLRSRTQLEVLSGARIDDRRAALALGKSGNRHTEPVRSRGVAK